MSRIYARQRAIEREIERELAALRADPRVRVLDHPAHGYAQRHIDLTRPWLRCWEKVFR